MSIENRKKKYVFKIPFYLVAKHKKALHDDFFKVTTLVATLLLEVLDLKMKICYHLYYKEVDL